MVPKKPKLLLPFDSPPFGGSVRRGFTGSLPRSCAATPRQWEYPPSSHQESTTSQERAPTRLTLSDQARPRKRPNGRFGGTYNREALTLFRENEGMSLSLCTDISAADWLVGQDLPWYQLTASGPIGFPAYARLRFIPDPTYEGQRENDAEGPADTLTPADDGYLTENDQFKIVAEILTPYTSTPEDCFFCLWDGWGQDVIGDDLPMVKIPNRDYWLFRGALSDLGDWGSDVKMESYETVQNPAFMWPADRAWWIASHGVVYFGSVNHQVRDQRVVL